MKWQGRRGSRNIEDRRGSRGGAARIGGAGGIGVLVIVLIGWFLGVDTSFLTDPQGGAPVSQTGYQPAGQDDAAAQFVSVVLADTEQVWSGIFESQLGQRYDPPVLVLFSGVTPSACGNASGATGPFYCPVDQKVYLDTAFFAELRQRFGANGDFAAAYVVAHEVAHHVQDELGILGKTTDLRQRVSEADSNAISVMVELQADCLSGVWARAAQSQLGTLERGDLEEALNAAGRIGDDTLQRQSGRVPRPDSFTHGSSEQRQRWFAQGYQSGDIGGCDTFGASAL
ncbi:neutral zinc metallopeptidase [Tropicimonas sp. IMCC34043]|uniref:KPN_02809 family neutral zinc metallopeptidase n=1 Tax=Tropicimonas sp. IMCC34043 TaxID=2248760 RepID=UPI000E21C97B|nr:neutral zinc metallopeptidase [Tropicimonas sp. IMCC34043]